MRIECLLDRFLGGNHEHKHGCGTDLNSHLLQIVSRFSVVDAERRKKGGRGSRRIEVRVGRKDQGRQSVSPLDNLGNRVNVWVFVQLIFDLR